MNFVVVDNNKSDLSVLANAISAAMPACQVQRKNIPKLAVVMLSSGELNRIGAIHAGVDDYCIKPISAEILEGMTKQFAI